ncbi:hypothetical protein EV363DRAFT_1395337 [Boletus edulis]|nr:hypothetical protein EV363DRAFT_1395337 [Boletus edulis]
MRGKREKKERYGFPKLEEVTQGLYRDILAEVIALYETNSWEVEADYFPEHKHSMRRLLFNNTQTFRSDIKKAVMKSIHFDYELYPPPTAKSDEEGITAVKHRASKLLGTSAYLQGPPDAEGKANNFTYKALRNIYLSFYYNSAAKSLHQFAEFQQHMPYRALALVTAMVHTILTSFRKHGVEKAASTNVAWHEVESAYYELNAQLATILEHPYHGPKLDLMLEDWTRNGM